MMNLSITIEVNDQAPKIELCGDNCKFLLKGNCRLFKKQLEDYSHPKIEGYSEGETIDYGKTQILSSWKRCEECIHIFYSYCDS